MTAPVLSECEAAPKRPRGRGRQFPKGHIWTPEQDAILRKVYADPRHQKKIPGFRAVDLAQRFGCSIYVVYIRARNLGIAAHHGASRPWTTEELTLLEDTAHLTLRNAVRKFIAAGYRRTEAAIRNMRIETEMRARDSRRDAHIYSAQALSERMGVSDAAVKGWIDKGLIKAKRIDRGKSEWAISAPAIRDFIVNYTSRINLASIDKYWLIDILCQRHGRKGETEE